VRTEKDIKRKKYTYRWRKKWLEKMNKREKEREIE